MVLGWFTSTWSSVTRAMIHWSYQTSSFLTDGSGRTQSMSRCFPYPTITIFFSVLEYTVLFGLTLNVDILTPFLAFLLVLATKLYLCYAKLQSKYKQVKKIISEKLQELRLKGNVPNHPICAEMYWFVCDKVLPIKSN